MKLIQIWCGETNTDLYKKYERSMDMVREMFLPNYERIIIKDMKGFFSPIIVTDTVRIEYATQEPEMLYADCDIEFKKIPDFETGNGRPYFGHGIKGKINHCLFYVNNNTKFFQKIIDERNDRNLPYVHGWPMKIIRKKKVNVIPKNLYNHHCYTSTEIWRKYESGSDHPWESVGANGRKVEWD